MTLDRVTLYSQDVTQTVFDNETVAILYITKDIYSECYVIALPVYTFSWSVSFDRLEGDLKDILSYNLFGHMERREKLVEAIKEGIEALY